MKNNLPSFFMERFLKLFPNIFIISVAIALNAASDDTGHALFLPPNSRCQEVLLHLLFLNFTPFAPCLKERGGEILDEVLVLLQDESSEEGGREGMK